MPGAAIAPRCEGEVSLLREPTEIAALGRAWDRLAPASPPTCHHAWSLACAKALQGGPDAKLMVIGPLSAPRAIAPLVVRDEAHPVIELLGAKELYEPMELTAGDEASLEELVESISRLGRPLLLHRVPEGSRTLAALRRIHRGRAALVVRTASASPYVPLEKHEDPAAIFSARLRSDLRRARRRAERMGPVSFEMHEPSREMLGPLLREAFEVEASGWKGRTGSALNLDLLRGRFYRLYSALAAELGTLRLAFLRIGDRAAAMQIAVEVSNAYWLLKIGYDESFAACSPGSILLAETITWAKMRGLASYELLGGVEPWTRRWTRDARSCVAARTYPWTGLGAETLMKDATRAARGLIASSFGWKW
jgi:CelD/BcsL family acetyltransferase involved in cellulose biosynthesis